MPWATSYRSRASQLFVAAVLAEQLKLVKQVSFASLPVPHKTSDSTLWKILRITCIGDISKRHFYFGEILLCIFKAEELCPHQF